MSHDIEAAWAAAEVASLLGANPGWCFRNPPQIDQLSAYAMREGRSPWPLADGVVRLEVAGGAAYNIAMEYKRPNEGLHGLLTAVGQAHAYLHKGYPASAIVVPSRYDAMPGVGSYVQEMIATSCGTERIGVLTYEGPDNTKPSPFDGKMDLIKGLAVDLIPAPVHHVPTSVTETQWAHLREGSSTPDAFFRYLQTAKRVSAGEVDTTPSLPLDLIAAAQRKNAGGNPAKYFSYTVSDDLRDRTWRAFWFGKVLTDKAAPIWRPLQNSQYEVNDTATELMTADGDRKMVFFVGRRDSIKDKLVQALNNQSITESQAWDEYAERVHDRAHSFREDVDSGLDHMGLLNSDGRPTELGYRFVDACERTGNPTKGTPRSILMAALLRNGQLGALLHYIYRLSEGRFSASPLDFSTKRGDRFVFLREPYLDWVEDQLANELHVIHKVPRRGGRRRRPFQAELAVLRKFGLVNEFRLGVGLEVNWPAVQAALEFPIDG